MIALDDIPDSKIYAYLINRTLCGKNKALLASIYAVENANGDTVHLDLEQLEYDGAKFDHDLALNTLKGYKI